MIKKNEGQVSNLVFYAQSTSAVISGRYGGHRKKEKNGGIIAIGPLPPMLAT